MKRHYSDSQVRSLREYHKVVYDPKRREDLVVNRNRVKDLGDWIDRAVASPGVSLLLLCGPPGCGKTATVRVLAAEKGIELVDWTTPIDSYECSEDNENLMTRSVGYKFKQFLLRVGRYNPIVKDKILHSNGRLIIVKDFPTCFLTSPDQFVEIIDFYVIQGRTSVIFICTESSKKKSTDIAYELFSEEFKQKHNIFQLSFIPVPITSVIKAIKRVVQLSRSPITDDKLRDIAIESRGDIRKAINDVKFFSVNALKLNKCASGQAMKPPRCRDKRGNVLKDVDKETTGLFHSVGRVLYAKRDLPRGTSKNESESLEDPRGNFVHKPLDIVREFSHYSYQFVSLAHSNYLDIFSSLECIVKAAEYLSDSDIIMSEWREKELLGTVGFSVAVSGLMEANNDPIRRWKPLKGSQWNEDLKRAATNRCCIENILSDNCVSKSGITLEIVPYMKQMWCSKMRESSLTKWCPYGFLPHRSEDVLSLIRKIKTDVLTYTPLHLEGSKSDSDVSFHISDDSD